MEQQLQEIREQQKASWNKFSPGWRKWDVLVSDFLKPMGDEIIRLIKPKGKEMVLDVAAGSGEPGLTIATMLSGGKVMITDLAEDMLAIARDYATERGINNAETVVADVCELPFGDETFDAISCRMGFMFFPDMQLAANEMARVLKPGGRIATAVWSAPEKNFWATAMMTAITKYVDIPPPPPGSPGLFRCAADGLVADLFKNAGLKNISQTVVTSKMRCKTTDIYWDFTTEVAAPVAAALGKADEAAKEKIKKELYRMASEKYPDGNVTIDASALVIYGEK